ncbi:MAG: TetR/AcrR family transcriptional regulator, partial [Acidimicrobiales bacterium]
RTAETRQRLLDAAARLYAERGIEAVSIDTIAEAADRTSGAVYAHFGGKDGLLNALLENLVNESAAVMDAELSVAPTEQGPSDEHLAALWRTFASPPPGPSAGWMLLEHELWLYASRNEAARAHFAERFDEARRMVVDSTGSWPDDSRSDPPGTPDQVAALLVALLVGLEMQHRVDPGAVSDETAVIGLRAVTGLRRAPTPPAEPETAAPTTSRSTTSGSTTSRSTTSGAPRRKTPTRRTS